MLRKNNFLIITAILVFIFGTGIVLAQEATTTDAQQAISLDENIQPQDLGVKNPLILPDNPLYFLKEWGRGIQSLLTFDSVKKAALKEKVSNEKLIELQKMVEENKNSKKIENAINNYQNSVEDLKNVADKIKDKAEQNPEVGKFLDKFIQQQTLQQKIIQKLETQVSTSTMAKIEEVKEKHLENFGEVMTKLEDNKAKIQGRIEKNLQELKGSEFKDFNNLEILKGLEGKAPEEVKGAIQKVQENILKGLEENIKKISPAGQEKLQEYLQNSSGETGNKIEVLENLRSELKGSPQIKEALLKVRDKILENIGEKNCPTFTPPDSNFCKDGRIMIEKDSTGCPLTAKCLIPGEFSAPEGNSACVTLWNPVCGKNKKTYSNSCFAEAAGVEIDYKGACQNKESSDNSSTSTPPKPTITAPEAPAKTSVTPSLVKITIKNSVFDPSEVKIRTRGTILFKNEDTVSYTIRTIEGEIIIPRIESGKTWSYGMPSSPQIIEFTCDSYPNMKGKITVFDY